MPQCEVLKKEEPEKKFIKEFDFTPARTRQGASIR